MNKSNTPLPPADFTPDMGEYRTLQPFRYWCQKVLPLVYDDSLSYYELLCKVVDYLNKTMEDVETLHGDVNNLHTAYEELQSYVNNYFSTLDVQEEINNKLNQMSSDGTLSTLIYGVIGNSAYPKFVSSTKEMTNKQAIYVLSTSGELYYYNGTQFIPSGIMYGAGNGALSCYNHLISSSTGETLNFTSFNDCEKNKIYAYVGQPTEYITGLPDFRYNGILVDFAFAQNSDTGRLQIFSNMYQSWFRINWLNAWTTWFSNSPSSEIYITKDNYINYSDIRNLPTNNCYAIAKSITSSDMVANLPTYGVTGVLYKVNMDSNEESDFSGEMMLYCTSGKMYFSQHFGNAYSTWVDVNSVYPYTIGVSNNWYGYTDYNEFGSGVYIIYDTNGYLKNSPIKGILGVLVSADNNAGGYQILYQNDTNTTANMRTFIRYKWAKTWGTWYSLGYNGYNLSGNNAIKSLGLPNDLNQYYQNGVYAISSTITEDYLKNLPTYGESGILVITTYSPIAKNGVLQMFCTNKNTVWFRIGYGTNTFNDWIGVTETGADYFINTCVEKPFNLTSKSKILAFGDSITAGYGVGSEKVWVKLLADKVGCQLENQAVSASTFNEKNSNSIKAQYEKVTNWETITHVFIAGGVNDASTGVDKELFKKYVQNTVNYIRARTQVPILFITPIERNNTVKDTIHYSSIINSVALANDCSVINGYDVPIPFRTTDYYTNLTSDGIHPNEIGQRVYARYVLNCIM